MNDITEDLPPCPACGSTEPDCELDCPEALHARERSQVTLNFPGYPPIKGVGPVIEGRESE